MSTSSKASRLRGRLSINPDEIPTPVTPTRPVVPVASPAPAPEETPVGVAESPTNGPVRVVEPAIPPEQPRQAPRSAGEERMSALDDPTIVAGRRDYRSFYVEDAAFARFRAAIYWLSRREDAAGMVPENMSVAVESFMVATADDLERRYNEGQAFRMPPGQRRRRATSQNNPDS